MPSQSEVNSALSSLLASDPNASPDDIIAAAARYGITADQIYTAFDAQAPEPAPPPAQTFTNQDIVDAYNQSVGSGQATEAEFVDYARSVGVTDEQLRAAQGKILEQNQGISALPSGDVSYPVVNDYYQGVTSGDPTANDPIYGGATGSKSVDTSFSDNPPLFGEPGYDYTQEDVNRALNNLLASDPNASYSSIVDAAKNYGITPDEIDTAFSDRDTGMGPGGNFIFTQDDVNSALQAELASRPGTSYADLLAHAKNTYKITDDQFNTAWRAAGNFTQDDVNSALQAELASRPGTSYADLLAHAKNTYGITDDQFNTAWTAAGNPLPGTTKEPIKQPSGDTGVGIGPGSSGWGDQSGRLPPGSPQFYQPIYTPGYEDYNLGSPLSISQYGQTLQDDINRAMRTELAARPGTSRDAMIDYVTTQYPDYKLTPEQIGKGYDAATGVNPYAVALQNPFNPYTNTYTNIVAPPVNPFSLTNNTAGASSTEGEE